MMIVLHLKNRGSDDDNAQKQEASDTHQRHVYICRLFCTMKWTMLRMIFTGSRGPQFS